MVNRFFPLEARPSLTTTTQLSGEESVTRGKVFIENTHLSGRKTKLADSIRIGTCADASTLFPALTP